MTTPVTNSDSGQEPQKIYKLGEKGTGIRLQGPVQDFDCLREECLSTGELFEDPQFPAVDSSIFISKRPARYRNGIEWIRPLAFRANAQFYVEGAPRVDLEEGRFGNLWVLAAVVNVAMHKDLLDKVIPPGQSFQENYAGIFRFRFWQHGKWVEVVIDDRLPTYDGELIGMRSDKKNAFWCSLLEKAYAKLHGSWEDLKDRWNGEVLTDLTGGIVQRWMMGEAPPELFDVLWEAQKMKSVLSSGRLERASAKIDRRKTERGLILDHAYSITKVMYLDGNVVGRTEKIPLLKLRNPWGFKKWEGAWSDSSPEWQSIPEDIRKKLGLVCGEDGEFWISFEDWKRYFGEFEICYMTPSLVMERNTRTDEKIWQANEIFGEWVYGSSTGRDRNDLDKFQYNPQYRIKFEKDSTAIVALTRMRLRTQGDNIKKIYYRFQIYELPEERNCKLPKPLDVRFLKEKKPLEMNNLKDKETFVRYSPFPYQHQFSCRMRLRAGAYCIIPYALEKNKEAEFSLRVISEMPNNLEEYDVQVGPSEVCDKVRKSCHSDADEVEVVSVFRQYSGDEWEIGWRELKVLLDSKLHKELSKKGLSEDACRSMVALFDADCSGKLGYHEFKELWKNLKIWKAAYNLQGHTPDGYLEPYTLKEVMRKAGFLINNQVSDLLVRRYGTEGAFIKFDNYIMIAAKFNRACDTLEKRATARTNTISFTDDEWFKITLNS